MRVLNSIEEADLSSFSKSASLPAAVGIWIGGPGCSLHIRGPCLIFSQVIGALPWVVNSASVATPAPAQSLQVQAVTPQLLLNAQGQVIATLAGSPLPQPVAVRKPNTPESPAKSEVPGLGVWVGAARRSCLSSLPLKSEERSHFPEGGLSECTHALPRETAPILSPAHHIHVSVPPEDREGHRGQRRWVASEQSRLASDYPRGEQNARKVLGGEF